ncbi:hypothetical protein [Actinomadura macrotermitis]|uniref:Uncharacterized protein n=1 Tax=Actinomadura macrotermitis TaxID=2585200 RepID=A0A7K0BMI8_9ACTN|nr:hypothetical protein [Actinomadura macrotermitis]MQY02082.1 hypothetical protein [Actinomadura macrotermitis]
MSRRTYLRRLADIAARAAIRGAATAAGTSLVALLSWWITRH